MNRPHILLLMADHLRRDCLSAYGSLPVRTPNLDALADESVVFENAYCATPLCTPTRVSMYTGKYPHVHGAVANTLPATVTGPEHETLYERLDKTGYGITHVGVHHCRLSPSVEERVPAGIFESMKDWA
ncbi:MAG: sulfatase-like hydrolase/transferase, partial [Planctomycetota bacterium]|nr:sulfatase-like hydrolase/transferase [Planctomycetota bacterium]